MKKITFLLISFLFILFSCNQNKIETSGNKEEEPDFNITIPFNYEIKDGHLVFKTLNDYENAINYLVILENEEKLDLWYKKTKFVSQYYLTKNNITKENFVEDEILMSLLNDKGEIQIKDKIFQLDNKSQTVLVKSEKSQNLKKYSFNDEVIVKEFLVDSLNYASKGNDYADICNPGYSKRTISGVRIWYKVAYFKYGIYFTLVSKIKKKDRNFDIIIGTKTYGHIKNRRREEDFYYNWNEGRGLKYKIRPYYSTRRLIVYEIIGDFRISVFNTHYGYYDTYVYTKQCPCEG